MPQQMNTTLDRLRNVIDQDRLRRIVADAAWCPEENNSGGDFFSQDHGIMAGAAGHAVRLASRLPNCFFYPSDYFGGHLHGALVHVLLPTHRQPTSTRDRLRVPDQIFDGTHSNVIAGMPYVKAESSLFRNHIDRARPRLHSSHSRDQTRTDSCRAFDRRDPLRRASQGIETHIHWRRPRMIRTSAEFELEPTLARNGVDDA